MRPWSSHASLVLTVVMAAMFGLVAYAIIGAQEGTPARVATTVVTTTSVPPSPMRMIVAGQPGVALYTALMIFVMLVVGLATGIQTSTAIVGEKERQTYDLLWTTWLRPSTILWGKYVTGFGFGLLLTLVVAPVFSLVIVFDSVPWTSVLASVVLLIACIAASAAVGLWYSAVATSTLSASLLTSLTLLTAMFGAGGLYITSALAGLGPAWQTLLFFSPPAALLSSISGSLHQPWMLLLPAEIRASPEHPVHVVWHIQNPVPLWIVTSALLLIAAFFLLAASSTVVSLSGGRELRLPQLLWITRHILRVKEKAEKR
jgi:ABC-type Na+ efflux pump permease subunit